MTATVETKIWQALRARVATISGYAANQFAWPKAEFEKPDTGGSAPRLLPYLEIRQLRNRVNRPFVGSRDLQDRPGILQISLMWPATDVLPARGATTHPDVLEQKAGEIAAHFRTDSLLSFQGRRVRVTKDADIAEARRDEAYWRIPISIPYETYP